MKIVRRRALLRAAAIGSGAYGPAGPAPAPLPSPDRGAGRQDETAFATATTRKS